MRLLGRHRNCGYRGDRRIDRYPCQRCDSEVQRSYLRVPGGDMKFSTGMEGKKEASALCKDVCAVRERLRRHELLAEPLEAAFKEVLSQLSDLLCPYPVEKLDRRVKELDDK